MRRGTPSRSMFSMAFGSADSDEGVAKAIVAGVFTARKKSRRALCAVSKFLTTTDAQERSELGPARPAVPLAEQSVRMDEGGGVVDFLEALLEQVGTVKAMVVVLNGGELLSLLSAQVPWVFQEREAAGLERLAILSFGHRSDLITADLVDGVQEQPNDVKAIEDDFGLGQAFRDALDVRGRHVHGHHFDAAFAHRSERLEEAAESLRALPFGRPDHSSPFVIDHYGEELGGSAVADLIHPDEVQIREKRAVELLVNDSAGDVASRDPTDTHVGRRGCLIGVLEKPAGFVFERAGEDRPFAAPRHAHGAHPAALAHDPVHAAAQQHDESKQAKVPPGTKFPLRSVPARAPTTAVAALETAGARLDVDHDGLTHEWVGVDLNGFDRACQTEKLLEECGQAHGRTPFVGVWRLHHRGDTDPCATLSIAGRQ